LGDLPETHRARDARDWYARGLFTLAEQLARRGHVELWERVSAPTKNDLLTEWQEGLQRVDQYRGEGRFREGVTEARRLLQRADSVGGPDVNQLLAFTFGRLGECLFHVGKTEEARARFTEALQLFTHAFRTMLAPGGVKSVRLPARSPNLNAYAERFVGSVRRECLARVIPLGERHLRQIVQDYVAHYHAERNH
jgi:hypothetical protein